MAPVDWSSLPPEHNLAKFAGDLSGLLTETGHDEMYGVKLEAPSEGKAAAHTTLVILQKFLRANMNDLPKAKTQLTEALKWRKSYNPLAARDEVFSASKFSKLGYVLNVKGAKETVNEEDVATFNIYGAAAKETWGDADAFIRWRVALMELTVSELHLESATKPIPDYGEGPDPYQALQIHDYLNVSFFRQSGEIKAMSSKIITMFQKYYPETVSYKYFVNVPLLMQWMMGAMKLLMSKDSVQKMTWLSYANQLAQYLGSDVPKEYGGTGADLKAQAITPKYDDDVTTTTSTVGPAATKPDAPASPTEESPETLQNTKGEATKAVGVDPVKDDKDAVTAA